MAGITSYGAYVPLYRLGGQTAGWSGLVEKAMASFDEDSITMAVAAAIDCMNGMDRSTIDGLYFATTTSPYVEKQAATTIATAADLRRDSITMDFTDSLRAGTNALRAAFDAVKAGSAKQVMVTAAEMRLAQPRSAYEAGFGDGAAALLIGDEKVAASIVGWYSVTNEILDVWRSSGETIVDSWEERFVLDEGYRSVLSETISGLFAKCNVSAKDFAKAVYYAPDARRHTEMARKIGLEPGQVQPLLIGAVGNTGAAFALMMLVAALEEAKPGDRILLANYGDGADAFILEVTEEINKIRDRRGMKGYMASKKILGDYQTYAAWRGFIDVAAAVRRPEMVQPSPTAVWRERDANIRFHGVKCKSCGYPQYPPQRVCTKCHAKDNFEDVRFSDKKGTVFTYAMDYLAPTPDPPLVIAIVNFEGGGRIVSMMTDRDINEVKIGMPVELTFRKLFTAKGVHNYYWKSMPLRG
ncbi:MAG: 3-hydroxy-3-methylglutaryl CoA synthase [Dehalococcoidia bacterium]|nr:MAG: 3-hydroxy-3-methylglutaryl CoA synthase [Dehalococcoidia bacterium]